MYRSRRPFSLLRALGAGIPALLVFTPGLFACEELEKDLEEEIEPQALQHREAPGAEPSEVSSPEDVPADLDAPGGASGSDAVPEADEAPESDATPNMDMTLEPEAAGKGELAKDLVRRIVRAHIGEIRHCYNELLLGEPGASGRVEVRFEVSSQGEVALAEILESTLDDETFQVCMATAVERWRFPKPRGGGKVIVTYPFVFTPE